MKPALDDERLAELVGQLADEFTERLNRGEHPDVEEYARRHPEAADVLRQVLPTLEVMRVPVPVPTGFTIRDSLGDYRIVREIGRGGMGIVYEAEQISLRRRVALKVMPASPAADPAALARFQREAKVASELHHTSIVPVFAVGCEQGVHFYAMQYIDGAGLDRLLHEMRKQLAAGKSLCEVQGQQDLLLESALPEVPTARPGHGRKGDGAGAGWFARVAGIGIQVADALGHAHQRGVVHRDIKPSNLILDRHGTVWISDFGLVKSMEESDSNLTRTGDILGTARYMSPEQALGRRHAVGPRSDLYSLGATLYELLTLRPAFDALDQATILQQIAFDEPPAPRQINRDVPRELETIVQKAMAKDPGRRYASAAALAADLRRYRAGEPIEARPLGIVERLIRWTRRRPAVAALLLVSCLAALTIVIGALWSNAELRAANLREQQRAREAELANRRAQDRAREADLAKVREQHRAREAEEREQIGRRHLYAAQMTLVQQAWERGHVARVRTLLGGLRPPPGQPDIRGFEWFYHWRLSHRDRAVLAGHTHVVSTAAFSPDGRTLATGSHDGSIKLWDPLSGKLLRDLDRHHSRVTGIAFSADGKVLISAGKDGTVRLGDLQRGEHSITINCASSVEAVARSPDGKTLAAACQNGTIRLWDVPTRTMRAVLVGHSDAVLAVAFSPDGVTLASGGGDRSVRLWDLETCQPRDVIFGHIAPVRCVAFSGDGALLASGGDDVVRLWDAGNGRELALLRGHSDPVAGLAFTPDRRSLVSVSGDPANPLRPGDLVFKANTVRSRPGEIKVWNVATGMERMTFKGHAGPICCAAVAPDGRTLATGSDDTSVILWDLSGSEQATLPGHKLEVNALSFSPDGLTLATISDDRMVKLWDLLTGQERRTLLGHFGPGKYVVFSPDGLLLASAGGDLTIRLWDARTGAAIAILRGHRQTIRSLAFSPDGKLLLSGAGDGRNPPRAGEITLWDVARQVPIRHLDGPAEAVRTVAFSPDGKWVAAGSDDQTVRLWESATGKEIRVLRDHADWVRSVAFSRDGKTLASSSNDHTVKLWDLADPVRPGPPRPRLTLQGHRASVLNVVFAPDGQTLATGSTDGTVKLWDVVTGQERAVLEGHRGAIRAVGFSLDGRILATGDNDSRVKLWYAARQD